MLKELNEIARRRAELASSERYERRAWAGNGVWLSNLFLFAGPMLKLGRAIGISSIVHFAKAAHQGDVPAALGPVSRGLNILMTVDRIRKALLRSA